MAQTRTAFVTGGTGFLGLNLIEQLTQAGWRVVALHRRQSNLTYLKRFDVDLVEGAVEDRTSLERVLPPEVDAVFHVAADVSFWSRNNLRQTQCNVDGTHNMVAAALARGARKFIHTSSSGVYGLQRQPFDETAPKLGRDSWVNYMRTKAQAEEEVLRGIEHGLDAVMLNPANIIGRYDVLGWARLMRLALDAKLARVPPGSSSFCHGPEVARAHIAAVTQGRTGANYLLGGPDAQYVELLTTLGEVAGRAIRTRTAPKPAVRFAARVGGLISRFTRREPVITLEGAAYLCSNLICRSDRAVAELGYAIVPLRAMVEDWYRWSMAEGIIGRTADRAPVQARVPSRVTAQATRFSS
jgi:nucleoside-diphosphate-sugar epimerase